MQVIGLPRHIIRSAGAASRLLGLKTLDIEATRRRDAVARWQGARKSGLDAEQAAKAVGVGRATLYSWAKELIAKSRRPKRVRRPAWTLALVQAVEELRADNTSSPSRSGATRSIHSYSPRRASQSPPPWS